MNRIAVISIIFENIEAFTPPIPTFNQILSQYRHLIKSRMGLPLDDYHVNVITITVLGSIDEINSLTGKIGRLDNVMVKTAISKNEY